MILYKQADDNSPIDSIRTVSTTTVVNRVLQYLAMPERCASSYEHRWRFCRTVTHRIDSDGMANLIMHCD